jgi:hypothetical protein
MAINATPGSPTANSYMTVAEADTYFASGLTNTSVWDESSLQEEALIQAAFLLDQYDYVGITSDEYLGTAEPTQALKWPRVLNDEGDLIRNYGVAVIPPPIKYAQAELALALLAASEGDAVAEGTMESLKIGGEVEVKYATGGSAAVVDTSIDYTGLPIQVARFLKGLRLINVLA